MPILRLVYPAIIHEDADSDDGVGLCDLPGGVAAAGERVRTATADRRRHPVVDCPGLSR